MGIRRLIDNVQALTAARRTGNQKSIALQYSAIGEIVTELYASREVGIALEIESVMISGEMNGIPKASATHRTIAEYLVRIAKAERANALQEANPKKFHQAAKDDHAIKNFKDGTPYDAVRAALDECRKLAKAQIIAIGADENQFRRNCYIVRYDGLANAERAYIERQVAHQTKYPGPNVKQQAIQNSAKSFDARIRSEKRQLELTPNPNQNAGKQ